MKPMPQQPAADDLPEASSRAWLSALADGDARAVQPACDAWRDDEDARRTWHSYQLIGDLMRSEDLANPPGRDSAFLAGVRARLAAEPVVLAPAPVVQRRQPWLVPVAAAAGFAVVAGVLVVARMAQPGAEGPSALAVASGVQRGGAAGTQLVGTTPLASPQMASDPRFIHDPRLDEFLRVHQATRGSLLAAPGGTLRPMDVAVPVNAAR